MKKIIKEWKWTILILLLISAVGFILRFVNLTSLPVFADEAIYIRWSQIMATEPTLRFLPLSDGKQPLYMWILMLAVRNFSDPLFIGRLISVLSGVSGIFGIFALSYAIFASKKVSLIASAILALTPFSVFFDRMALVDSLLTALIIWTLFFAVLTAKTKRFDLAMVTGFFLGLSLLTKSPTLFIVLLLPLTWFFAGKKPNLLRLAILFATTVIIGYGMYSVLRLGPNYHMIALRNQDYVYPYNHIFTDPLNPLKGHLGGIINYFVLIGPLGIIPLILIGTFSNLRDRTTKLLPALLFAFIPLFVIAEFSKVVTARYILFTIPFFVILAASSFLSKTKWLIFLGWILLLLFAGQSLLFNYKLTTNVEAAPLPHGDRSGYLEEWTAGQGIREISETLKAEAPDLGEGEKIVVGTEGYFGTLPDGLQMYLTNFPNIVVVGVGVGIRELPQSLSESKEAGNKTYLVINKSRLQAYPEEIGLKLIAMYPKVPRREGSMEYKNLGPQEILYFFEVTNGN